MALRYIYIGLKYDWRGKKTRGVCGVGEREGRIEERIFFNYFFQRFLMIFSDPLPSLLFLNN